MSISDNLIDTCPYTSPVWPSTVYYITLKDSNGNESEKGPNSNIICTNTVNNTSTIQIKPSKQESKYVITLYRSVNNGVPIAIKSFSPNQSTYQFIDKYSGNPNPPPPSPNKLKLCASSSNNDLNITIFKPTDDIQTIKSFLTDFYNKQGGSGSTWPIQNGILILFEPGTYDFQNYNIPVSWYMSLRGLGEHPSDTVFKNCTLTVQNLSKDTGQATTNLFWRDVENIEIQGNIYWYISQGGTLRRVMGNGDFSLGSGKGASWASGGWISNIESSNNISVGFQQQFCYKNIKAPYINPCGINSTIINSSTSNSAQCSGGGGNVSVANIYGYSKPWISTNGINIPNKSKNSGSDLDIKYSTIINDNICVVTPGSTFSDINNIISGNSKFKAIIFTPGLYKFSDTLVVSGDNIIIFGGGFPIIQTPNSGNSTIEVKGNNCYICSIILDGVNTDTILHLSAGNGCKLYDIYPRVFSNRSGGVNRVNKMILIDQDDVYAENLWLWVADHDKAGEATWNGLDCPNGLTVNGRNVVICGLAVEHHNDIMTQWNGDNGACYFYQSEFPYGDKCTGNPSYVINDNVISHTFRGGGAYFVRWIPPPGEPNINSVFKMNSKLDCQGMIGANWRGLSSVKNVVDINGTTYSPVGNSATVSYCN